jgi:peptide/nickel transport system permease protein
MPGSFIDIMVNAGADPASIEQFKETWGLNDPLYVQYWNYMINLASGNAGTSLQFRQPVWELVKMRLFNTFILIGPGVTFAYLLGTGVGTLFGTNRDSALDDYGLMPVLVSGTLPEFFTSILLIIVFSTGIFHFFPLRLRTSLTFSSSRRLLSSFVSRPSWKCQ